MLDERIAGTGKTDSDTSNSTTDNSKSLNEKTTSSATDGGETTESSGDGGGIGGVIGGAIDAGRDIARDITGGGDSSSDSPDSDDQRGSDTDSGGREDSRSNRETDRSQEDENSTSSESSNTSSGQSSQQESSSGALETAKDVAGDIGSAVGDVVSQTQESASEASEAVAETQEPDLGTEVDIGQQQVATQQVGESIGSIGEQEVSSSLREDVAGQLDGVDRDDVTVQQDNGGFSARVDGQEVATLSESELASQYEQSVEQNIEADVQVQRTDDGFEVGFADQGAQEEFLADRIAESNADIRRDDVTVERSGSELVGRVSGEAVVRTSDPDDLRRQLATEGRDDPLEGRSQIGSSAGPEGEPGIMEEDIVVQQDEGEVFLREGTEEGVARRRVADRLGEDVAPSDVDVTREAGELQVSVSGVEQQSSSADQIDLSPQDSTGINQESASGEQIERAQEVQESDALELAEREFDNMTVGARRRVRSDVQSGLDTAGNRINSVEDALEIEDLQSSVMGTSETVVEGVRDPIGTTEAASETAQSVAADIADRATDTDQLEEDFEGGVDVASDRADASIDFAADAAVGTVDRVSAGLQNNISDQQAAGLTTASALTVTPEPVSTGTGLAVGGLIVGSVALDAAMDSEISIPNRQQDRSEIETPTDRTVQREIATPTSAEIGTTELGIGETVVSSELAATDEAVQQTEISIQASGLQQGVIQQPDTVIEEETDRQITEEDLLRREEVELDEEEQLRQRREQLERVQEEFPQRDQFEREFPTGEDAVVGEGTEEVNTEPVNETEQPLETQPQQGTQTDVQQGFEPIVAPVDEAAEEAATQQETATQAQLGLGEVFGTAEGLATQTETALETSTVESVASPGYPQQVEYQFGNETGVRPRVQVDLPELDGSGDSDNDDDEGRAEEVLTDFINPLSGERLETESGIDPL